MRVERFFLFFGPTLWSFKRGETEYGVKAIPLGGYVKITGMNPEEELPPEVERPRLLPPAGLEADRRRSAPGPRSTSSSPSRSSSSSTSSTPRRSTSRWARSAPARPAAKVLQPGDRILAVDGKRFPGLEQRRPAGTLRRADRLPRMRRQAGRRLPRGDAGRAADQPRRPGADDLGPARYDKAAERALVGFSYGSEPDRDQRRHRRRPAPLDSIWMVTSQNRPRLLPHLRRGTAQANLRHRRRQRRRQPDDRLRRRASLLLLALVSLSLGLINLLPILPLDGGHIFWSLVEKLRGRPVSLRVMERASVIGFVLVLMLFVIGLSNDIGRLSGEGFNPAEGAVTREARGGLAAPWRRP